MSNSNRTSILCPHCAKDYLYIMEDRGLEYYQCNGCDSTFCQLGKKEGNKPNEQ